jgi:hypothetical protein
MRVARCSRQQLAKKSVQDTAIPTAVKKQLLQIAVKMTANKEQ